MHEGRKIQMRRIVASTLSLASAAVVGMASPALADPNINDVKAKVQQLDAQSEQASERLNLVSSQADEAQAILTALSTDLATEQASAAALRSQVASIVASEYQGQSLSSAAQVALSSDPTSFIRGLGAVDAYNTQQGQLLGVYADQLTRINLRQTAVTQESATLANLKAQMAAAKKQADDAAAQAQNELNRLSPRNRAAVLSAVDPAPITNYSVAASGAAAIAIQYALAQVGKPYIHGGTGPVGYDCSGLTMMAWGAAGVGLPHLASAQQRMGTQIPLSQIQPGDLLFYGNPAYHVAMYLGNGMMVEAANPRYPIRVTALRTPTSATRVG